MPASRGINVSGTIKAECLHHLFSEYIHSYLGQKPLRLSYLCLFQGAEMDDFKQQKIDNHSDELEVESEEKEIGQKI